ncbi:hypothetical protein [Azospirillum sp. B4]|uniref:hypothetical protein n=1 Tax=Azospirillum sp. B4 TaxID=95605 RepID=UPI0011DE3F82|nr:hypothetical protein [Azospirillum sp. B4]
MDTSSDSMTSSPGPWSPRPRFCAFERVRTPAGNGTIMTVVRTPDGDGYRYEVALPDGQMPLFDDWQLSTPEPTVTAPTTDTGGEITGTIGPGLAVLCALALLGIVIAFPDAFASRPAPTAAHTATHLPR